MQLRTPTMVTIGSSINRVNYVQHANHWYWSREKLNFHPASVMIVHVSCQLLRPACHHHNLFQCSRCSCCMSPFPHICVVMQVSEQKCQQECVPPQQVQEHQQKSCSQPISFERLLSASLLPRPFHRVGINAVAQLVWCVMGHSVAFLDTRLRLLPYCVTGVPLWICGYGYSYEVLCTDIKSDLFDFG